MGRYQKKIAMRVYDDVVFAASLVATLVIVPVVSASLKGAKRVLLALSKMIRKRQGITLGTVGKSDRLASETKQQITTPKSLTEVMLQRPCSPGVAEDKSRESAIVYLGERQGIYSQAERKKSCPVTPKEVRSFGVITGGKVLTLEDREAARERARKRAGTSNSTPSFTPGGGNAA